MLWAMFNCPHCQKPINPASMLGSVKSARKAKASQANGAKRKANVRMPEANVRLDKPTVSPQVNYGERNYSSAYTSR